MGDASLHGALQAVLSDQKAAGLISPVQSEALGAHYGAALSAQATFRVGANPLAPLNLKPFPWVPRPLLRIPSSAAAGRSSPDLTCKHVQACTGDTDVVKYLFEPVLTLTKLSVCRPADLESVRGKPLCGHAHFCAHFTDPTYNLPVDYWYRCQATKTLLLLGRAPITSTTSGQWAASGRTWCSWTLSLERLSDPWGTQRPCRTSSWRLRRAALA